MPDDVATLRSLAVAAMRILPRVRGHGRLSAAINSRFLQSGAAPIAMSSMLLGHKLLLDSRVPSQARALFSGEYDDGKVGLLASLLPAAGTFLDVGANIGLYSVPLGLAAAAKSGRGVAFEPFSANCARLRANLELNGLEEIVAVRQIGLSSRPGTAELSLREDFAGGAGVGNASIVIDDGKDESFVRTTIELSRLDDIWLSLGLSRLDVVKVDIEGHEDLFLQGAHGTLARFRPVLLMEVNRWFFRRRAVDFDSAIPACLPPQYRFFRQSKPRFRLSVRHKILPMTETARLAECEDLDDVFLVPAEKAGEFMQALGGPVSMLSARGAGA